MSPAASRNGMKLIELGRERWPGAQCTVLIRPSGRTGRRCAPGGGQADERDRRVWVFRLQAHRELSRARVCRAMGPVVQDIRGGQDACGGHARLVAARAAIGPAGRRWRVEAASQGPAAGRILGPLPACRLLRDYLRRSRASRRAPRSGCLSRGSSLGPIRPGRRQAGRSTITECCPAGAGPPAPARSPADSIA